MINTTGDPSFCCVCDKNDKNRLLLFNINPNEWLSLWTQQECIYRGQKTLFFLTFIDLFAAAAIAIWWHSDRMQVLGTRA